MNDELYMRRCLELAEMGSGSVSPNPMVGCVIVSGGLIIGEGFHQKYGSAHAEVNAVRSVLEKYGSQAHRLLKEATAYVNLEPCAHFGKTPPCADLLIHHQLKRVVVGIRDPFLDVDGKGIEKLEAAGTEVRLNVLEKECRYLNRRFLTRVIHQRPFIILKWARTANGYFAPHNSIQSWISGPLSKKIVHKWRAEEDALIIGKQTAIIDNPQLSAREWKGKNPTRIIIDRNLNVPLSNHVYSHQAKTIFFNELKTGISDNISYIQMEDMHFYLPQKIAYQLYLMDIQSVIIEGGANLLNQFISAGMWDEARIFNSSDNWETGIYSPHINGKLVSSSVIDRDLLTVYQNNPK